MRQTVVLKELSDNGTAVIEMERKSACSGDCDHCGGCTVIKETVTAKAVNGISARPGDRVIVESNTGFILKSAVIAYLMPVVLFFLFWFGGGAIGLRSGICGLAGFAIGIAVIVVYNRSIEKKGTIPFRIVAFSDRPEAN